MSGENKKHTESHAINTTERKRVTALVHSSTPSNNDARPTATIKESQLFITQKTTELNHLLLKANKAPNFESSVEDIIINLQSIDRLVTTITPIISENIIDPEILFSVVTDINKYIDSIDINNFNLLNISKMVHDFDVLSNKLNRVIADIEKSLNQFTKAQHTSIHAFIFDNLKHLPDLSNSSELIPIKSELEKTREQLISTATRAEKQAISDKFKIFNTQYDNLKTKLDHQNASNEITDPSIAPAIEKLRLSCIDIEKTFKDLTVKHIKSNLTSIKPYIKIATELLAPMKYSSSNKVEKVLIDTQRIANEIIDFVGTKATNVPAAAHELYKMAFTAIKGLFDSTKEFINNAQYKVGIKKIEYDDITPPWEKNPTLKK